MKQKCMLHTFFMYFELKCARQNVLGWECAKYIKSACRLLLLKSINVESVIN